MGDLFIRTASQALQAFTPIAFGLAALRRRGRSEALAGIYWGLCAAVIASVPAGALLQRTTRQSMWEAALALAALGAVAWVVRTGSRDRSFSALPLAAITVLLVTRQTMEIDSVFTVAAFELRSLDAVATISTATALALGLAGLWIWISARLGARACNAATRTFAALFAGQLALYAFHEAAEARLLPWSEVLHNATEPYGPDGVYGRHVAWFLIGLPLATAIVLTGKRGRLARALDFGRIKASGYAIAAGVALVAVGGGLSLRSSATPVAAPSDDVGAMARTPHVLFRHTAADAQYGRLSMASLADPAGRRVSLGMPCERVAFAAERGLCLQAARGVFTTYRAVLFDGLFNTVASWELSGSPSRARVGTDGRVGAMTVFVTGHGYGSSQFSTRTTLVDTASGDPLGDLEQFATWRDGKRFAAQDFNFWGVTFGRDSNHFYATLGTGGKTYLVKGELALRKLTVIYEGVECPSLSPDERLIAFKKRTSSIAGHWRLAILDLATMTERLLGSETRNIDDQIEWLDNDTVLYTMPREGSAVTDVWLAPASGASPARILIPAAESPAVVRSPGNVR